MPGDNSRKKYLGNQRAESIRETKHQIKQLKLKKKEYQAAKRELASQIAHLRASGRSMATYSRLPIPVPGRMGKGMRAAARAANATARAGLATTIRALEYQKGQLDQSIAEVDRALLQLERYLTDKGA